MPWLIDNPLREDVGERFRRHHPARKRVNATCSCPRVVNRFGVQNKWAYFVEQLQARKLPPPHLCASIVNVADLCAQSADVDRKIENFLTTKFVKDREHLLRLSEREHRNQDATAARECGFNRLRKPLLFAGPRPRRRNWRVATRAFHDEDVDLLFGKNRGLRDCLIIKVNVAGVKQCAPFSTNENSSGTENV